MRGIALCCSERGKEERKKKMYLATDESDGCERKRANKVNNNLWCVACVRQRNFILDAVIFSFLLGTFFFRIIISVK